MNTYKEPTQGETGLPPIIMRTISFALRRPENPFQIIRTSFDEESAVVWISREHEVIDVEILDITNSAEPKEQIPRTSISSTASLTAVRPSRRKEEPKNVPEPDKVVNCRTPSPPPSPIIICNDVDKEEWTSPSSYHILKVHASQPSPLHPWIVVQRPPSNVALRQLVDLQVMLENCSFRTRIRISRISRIGASWVHFLAEQEDWKGSETRFVEIIECYPVSCPHHLNSTPPPSHRRL